MKKYKICFMRFNGELQHCIVEEGIHSLKRKYFIPTSFDFVMSLVDAGCDREWLLSSLRSIEKCGHIFEIPANNLI